MRYSLYLISINYVAFCILQNIYSDTVQTLDSISSIVIDLKSDDSLDTIESLTRIFLNTLQEDDYHVVTNQPKLFIQYEKLLAHIVALPLDNIEQSTAICFANALCKGANIYRRIATDESLNQARAYHQKALAIKRKQLDCYALELAHSLVDLGATYNELKGKENNIHAIQCYNEGLRIYEHNKESGARYVASTLHKLGNAYRDLDEKNNNRAIEYLNRALQIFDTLPNDNYCRQEKAKVLYNQGVNYHHLDDNTTSKKAIDYLHRAKILFEHNGDSARLAVTLSYLGNVYRDFGSEYTTVAINYLDQALDIQKHLFGNEHTEIAITVYYLGMAYHDAEGEKNLDNAIEYFKNALSMQKKLLRENHPAIARTLYYLGLSYLERNIYTTGISLIKEALVIFKQLSPEHYYVKIAKKSFKQVQDIIACNDSEESKKLLDEIKMWD